MGASFGFIQLNEIKKIKKKKYGRKFMFVFYAFLCTMSLFIPIKELPANGRKVVTGNESKIPVYCYLTKGVEFHFISSFV